MHVLHSSELPLQPLDLRVRLAKLVLEPQHELDAGEVEPELGREPLDDAQPLDVRLGVEPRPPGVRCGRISPFVSYIRSVCGCMPTSSAATEIM